MGEKYFNSYRFRKGKVVGSTNIYISSDVSRLFPFITIITAEVFDDKRGQSKEVEFYELRDSNNNVIYTTDENGISVIFASSIAEGGK